jgi:hypothetical protein
MLMVFLFSFFSPNENRDDDDLSCASSDGRANIRCLWSFNKKEGKRKKKKEREKRGKRKGERKKKEKEKEEKR